MRPADGDEERPDVEARLTVLEKNEVIRVLSLAMTIGGPLVFAAFAAHLFPPGVIGLHLTIFGLVLRHLQRRQNHRPTKRERDVRMTAEGVYVDGARVLDRGRVADGLFQPRVGGRNFWSALRKRPEDRSSIRLLDKSRQIVFEAETEEPQALAMLRVLGLDPASRRAEFSAASPLHATMKRQFSWTFGALAAAGALGSVLAAHGPMVVPMIFLVMLPLIFVGAIPSKITVGVDGILTRWLWMKKFIAMSTIHAVLPEGSTRIRIVRTSGEHDILHPSAIRKNQGRRLAEQHRDAVLARIQECHRAFRSRGPKTDVTALVGRGRRTREEWLEALRRLRGAGADGGYRQAVVREEDLFRVVEDPSAPEDARAGAALVLRQALDDDGRARIRVAADATASPKLRVALDAALAPTEGDAEAAVREIATDDEEARAATRTS